MPAQVSPETDRLLHEAIASKLMIRLQYGGKERIVEPHDYGIQSGVVRVFCFQVGGQSSGRLPNWRLLDVPKISGLELLDQNFSGSRSTSYSNHLVWDKVFARVGP